VQGGASEPTHLFAQSNVALTRPRRQTAGCAALSPGRKMIKMIELPDLRARSSRHYNCAEEVSSVVWWNVESS
jgi:hypothetical protein